MQLKGDPHKQHRDSNSHKGLIDPYLSRYCNLRGPFTCTGLLTWKSALGARAGRCVSLYTQGKTSNSHRIIRAHNSSCDCSHLLNQFPGMNLSSRGHRGDHGHSNSPPFVFSVPLEGETTTCSCAGTQ